MHTPLAASPARAPAPPRRAISLLSYGASARLLGALLAVVALWLSVAWALSAA